MLLYKPCKFINLNKIIQFHWKYQHKYTMYKNICLQQVIKTKHKDMYMSTGMINDRY